MPGFNLTKMSDALEEYSRENSRQLFAKSLYMPGERLPEQPRHWLETVRREFFRDEQAFGRMEVELEVQERNPTVVEQSTPPITLGGGIRKLRDAETIFSITPELLENTWMDAMIVRRRKFGDQPGYEDIEFVPWLTQYLIDKWMEKLYLNTVWQGDYLANFAYTDSWARAADGFLTLITDDLAAVTPEITNVVATGAITSANAYDQLETMGKAVPAALRYKPVIMYCAEQIADFYNFDRTQTFPGDNGSLHPEYKLYRLRDRRNVFILPVPEMEGSQRVVISQEDNLSLDMDLRNATGPELVFHPKNVKEIQVQIKASVGMSLTMPQELIVNDQT